MAGCCRDEALWRCLLAAGPVLAGQVNACAHAHAQPNPAVQPRPSRRYLAVILIVVFR